MEIGNTPSVEQDRGRLTIAVKFFLDVLVNSIDSYVSEEEVKCLLSDNYAAFKPRKTGDPLIQEFLGNPELLFEHHPDNGYRVVRIQLSHPQEPEDLSRVVSSDTFSILDTVNEMVHPDSVYEEQKIDFDIGGEEEQKESEVLSESFEMFSDCIKIYLAKASSQPRAKMSEKELLAIDLALPAALKESQHQINHYFKEEGGKYNGWRLDITSMDEAILWIPSTKVVKRSMYELRENTLKPAERLALSFLIEHPGEKFNIKQILEAVYGKVRTQFEMQELTQNILVVNALKEWQRREIIEFLEGRSILNEDGQYWVESPE